MPQRTTGRRLHINKDTAMLLRTRLWLVLVRSIASEVGIDLESQVAVGPHATAITPKRCKQLFAALDRGDRVISRGNHRRRSFDLIAAVARVRGFESTQRFFEHPWWFFLARPTSTRSGIERDLQHALTLQTVSDELCRRLTRAREPDRDEKRKIMHQLIGGYENAQGYPSLDWIFLAAVVQRFLGLWGARADYPGLASYGAEALLNTAEWQWAKLDDLLTLQQLGHDRIFKHGDICFVADAIEGERPTQRHCGVPVPCFSTSMRIVLELVPILAKGARLSSVAQVRLLNEAQHLMGRVPVKSAARSQRQH